MKKSWLYLGAIGSLAVLTSSCGGGETPKPNPSASPTPTTSPAAANPAATPAPVATAPTGTTPATATSTLGTAPIVPGTGATKPVSPDVSAGLIPPTNGETWARTVSKGRNDPFEIVSLQLPAPLVEMARKSGGEKIPQSGVNKPLPKIATATNGSTIGERVLPASIPPSAVKTGTNIASIPRTGFNKALPKIKIAVNPSSAPKSSKLPQISVRPGAAARPPLRPTNIGAPETPTLPQIIGAKPESGAEKVLQSMAVEVSGIIEVEGKTQVIVKLPNETSSRYVDVGDRLSGNIFVKRVVGQTTLSPTVVFEENGREVERKVGDKAPTTATK